MPFLVINHTLISDEALFYFQHTACTLDSSSLLEYPDLFILLETGVTRVMSAVTT